MALNSTTLKKSANSWYRKQWLSQPCHQLRGDTCQDTSNVKETFKNITDASDASMQVLQPHRDASTQKMFQLWVLRLMPNMGVTMRTTTIQARRIIPQTRTHNDPHFGVTCLNDAVLRMRGWNRYNWCLINGTKQHNVKTQSTPQQTETVLLAGPEATSHCCNNTKKKTAKRTHTPLRVLMTTAPASATRWWNNMSSARWHTIERQWIRLAKPSKRAKHNYHTTLKGPVTDSIFKTNAFITSKVVAAAVCSQLYNTKYRHCNKHNLIFCKLLMASYTATAATKQAYKSHEASQHKLT